VSKNLQLASRLHSRKAVNTMLIKDEVAEAESVTMTTASTTATSPQSTDFRQTISK